MEKPKTVIYRTIIIICCAIVLILCFINVRTTIIMRNDFYLMRYDEKDFFLQTMDATYCDIESLNDTSNQINKIVSFIDENAFTYFIDGKEYEYAYYTDDIIIPFFSRNKVYENRLFDNKIFYSPETSNIYVKNDFSIPVLSLEEIEYIVVESNGMKKTINNTEQIKQYISTINSKSERNERAITKLSASDDTYEFYIYELLFLLENEQ